MSEQQAEALLALIRQIALDLSAIKAQGESVARSTLAISEVVKSWDADGTPGARISG